MTPISRRLSQALSVFALCASSAMASGNAGKPDPADLSRLVVVGDSLTAGFQNFSLYTSDSVAGAPNGGQKHGYAALIAQQAQAPMSLPLISFPGIPPVLVLNSGQIVRSAGIGSRMNPETQATNLSVPGFALGDVLARPFPGDPLNNAIDAMSYSVLAMPGVIPGCGVILSPAGTPVLSQLACARALNPTTVLVSAGNNDALGALTLGLPPTDPRVFQAQFHQLMTGLASTGASLVVANIPDVTAVPFLMTVPQFQSRCPSAVLPPGTSAFDYVVPDITNPAATSFDVCTSFAVRPWLLVTAARAAVSVYNLIIDAEARAVGAVVVDVNGLLQNLQVKGYRVGGKRLTTAFLGGIFSLDGIHPTNTGYAILANEFIKTMNTALHTDIEAVSVPQVAAADPLVF